MPALLQPAAVLALASALVVAGGGCVENHFRDIATQAAAQQSGCDGSSGPVKVRELDSYAYEAETCRGPAYYRCHFQRKTMGRVQCCGRVETYEEATATLFAGNYASPPVCREL